MHIDNGAMIILNRVGRVRNKVFMRKLTAMVYVQSEEMLWFACDFYSPCSCHQCNSDLSGPTAVQP